MSILFNSIYYKDLEYNSSVIVPKKKKKENSLNPNNS